VQLTFYDGRTLVCTPDHVLRVVRQMPEGPLAMDVAAADLRLADAQAPDRVLMGPDVAAPLAKEAADPEPWTLKLPALNKSLQWQHDTTEACAFARLLGLAATNDSGAALLNVGHQLDADAVQRDCLVLAGEAAAVRPHQTSNAWEIRPPSALAEDLALYTEQTHGKWLVQRLALPAVVTAASTPKLFVREFLAAYFGGIGKTSSDSSAGSTDDCVCFEACIAAAQLEDSKAFMSDVLGKLLREQFELDGCLEITAVDATAADAYTLTLALPAASTRAFSDCVGVRYCVQKQVRLTLAAAFCRANEYRQTAFQRFAATAVALYRREMPADKGEAAKRSIAAAVAAAASENPGLGADFFQLSPSELLHYVADVRSLDDASHGRCAPDLRAFAAEVGGADAFCDDALKSRLRGSYPTWQQPVLSCKSVGERRVYDVVGVDTELFLANGIIVMRAASSCRPCVRLLTFCAPCALLCSALLCSSVLKFRCTTVAAVALWFAARVLPSNPSLSPVGKTSAFAIAATRRCRAAKPPRPARAANSARSSAAEASLVI
jgi:hypothetical protein